MRLIDADVVQEHLNELMNDEYCDTDFKKACFGISIYIDTVPTIEPDPVKSGKWITNKRFPHEPQKIFVCSECGGFVELPQFAWECYYDYCPGCGAKMHKGDGNKN